METVIILSRILKVTKKLKDRGKNLLEKLIKK